MKIFTKQQEADLMDIALAESRDAGYAQALLNLLTGVMFIPDLPDLGSEEMISLPQDVDAPAIMPVLDVFTIYPNPAGDYLNVTVPSFVNPAFSIRTLELTEPVTGRLLLSISIDREQSIMQIPLRGLNNGIYILKLMENNAIVGAKRFIVQN